MKCPNCGFDSENQQKCPICGFQFAAEPVTAAKAPEGEVNPYTQGGAGQTNPYPQNNGEVNPYSQPLPARSPYQPQVRQPAPPQAQSPYAAPDMNFGGAPAPQAAVPKRQKSAVPYVLCGIAGAVIMAGIALAVFSSIFYNSHIFDILSESNGFAEDEYIYSDDYDDDVYDKDSVYFSDYGYDRGIGDTFSYAYGGVTLEGITAEKAESIGKNLYRYTATVTVSNSTDETIFIKPDEHYVSGSEDSFIVNEIKLDGDKEEIELKPGKSESYTIEFIGKKEAEFVDLSPSLSLHTEGSAKERTVETSFTVYSNYIDFKD